MSAFFCSSSSVVDGAMRSSMYARSCANMSFLGSLGSSMLSFLIWDSATSRMSKNTSHAVGLSTAPWLAPLTALNGRGRLSSMISGGDYFLSLFDHVVYAAGVHISVLPSLSIEMR